MLAKCRRLVRLLVRKLARRSDVFSCVLSLRVAGKCRARTLGAPLAYHRRPTPLRPQAPHRRDINAPSPWLSGRNRAPSTMRIRAEKAISSHPAQCSAPSQPAQGALSDPEGRCN